MNAPGWRGLAPPAPEVISKSRPGMHYTGNGYELSRTLPSNTTLNGAAADGTVVTCGPFWSDFRATVSVDADWARVRPDATLFATEAGLVFGLSEDGYAALLLSGFGKAKAAHHAEPDIAYELIRKSLPDGTTTTIVPIRIDDVPMSPFAIHEDALDAGLIGFALFGEGRAMFRDLIVESLP